jgi:hypothetical protein
MNVVEAVRDLYRGRWGEPTRQAAFRTENYEMEILKWDAAATDEGVDLYATLGASADEMPGGELGHRVEYFVGLQPGQDEIASALAALGLYARREGENVDHGHTVPADGPLWSGTEMGTFLVMRQLGEILPALTLPDGVHVEFLQAIPIFESERRFKVNNGAEKLLQHWERRGVPFWDPHRKAEPAL